VALAGGQAVAPGQRAPEDQPDHRGPDGHEIDRLIWVIHIFMAVLFVGWLLFFLFTVLKFRQRAHRQADYHTKHFKLPTYLEVGVAVFEVVLLCAFSFPIFSQVRQEMPSKDKSIEIRVVAEQFAWNIHYAGKDGIFGKTDLNLVNVSNPLGLDPSDPNGADDITTLNQLHVPVGVPVIAHLTSKDVIHSFGVPVMRVKQDVVPGQSIPSWFEAKKEGNFEIACAQLCGLGHYRMRGFFISESKEKFMAWLEEQHIQKVGAQAPAQVVTT
jgi:cytochrome c oxidase subunit 2